MSKRSDLYYKECREKSSGVYYKNYTKKMQELAIIFDANYRDIEFFRKHISKKIPFSEVDYLDNIKNILSSTMNNEVYIIKTDGHIQKAIVSKITDTHYTRKVFNLKRKEYIFINHQLRKVIGIYDNKGNAIWEFLDWGNNNTNIIEFNKNKIIELIDLNKK